MYGDVYTHSPEDVVVSINDYLLSGFAEGTYINIKLNSESFKRVAGIRGKSTRVHTRDRSGVITFSLLQTAPDNDVLSAIVAFDEVNMTGLLNVVIKDSGGSTGLQFRGCYITGFPTLDFSGDELSQRDWDINFSGITRFHVGGNQKGVLDFI